MTGYVLSLSAVSFLIAWPACLAMLRLGRRAALLDQAGAEAHKTHARAVPNTGGVGIAAALLFPMVAVLIAVWGVPPERWPIDAALVDGARAVSGGAAVLLAALGLVHVVGLIDDRRPLPAGLKLIAQAAAAAALVVFGDTRVLQLLDQSGPAGYGLSVAVSIAWLLTITNAINMLDNMDGLSAGVAAIAAAVFMGAALLSGQWFVGGAAALLLGALLAFLYFNFPPAKLFMGDGGSLVVGLMLGVLAMRVVYVPEGVGGAGSRWHGLLTPLIVLAVPLYDLCSVVGIRLVQGRRPWVGDNQHFSHRLVQLGLSRRRAVGVIYLIAGAVGAIGLVIGRVAPWQAAVLGAAVAGLLAMLAVLERGAWRSGADGRA